MKKMNKEEQLFFNLIGVVADKANYDYNEQVETAKRLVKSWSELLSGYNIDEKSLYKTFEVSGESNLVIAKDIEFASICRHHLLPFFGKIAIGYIPNGKVLGLSKFARIVDCFAKRLQLQETLVNDIAMSIKNNLNINDFFVIAQATHGCIMCRGVEKTNMNTINIYTSGKYKAYNEFDIISHFI